MWNLSAPVSKREQTPPFPPLILLLQTATQGMEPCFDTWMAPFLLAAPKRAVFSGNKGGALQKVKVMEYTCGFSAANRRPRPLFLLRPRTAGIARTFHRSIFLTGCGNRWSIPALVRGSPGGSLDSACIAQHACILPPPRCRIRKALNRMAMRQHCAQVNRRICPNSSG